MRRIPLLPEPTSPARPDGRTAPLIEWLRHDGGAPAILARQRINAWYEVYPDHDGSLARRLRSRTDAELLQALDELYVHWLLRQRWNDVGVEEGAGPRPDFTCYDQGRITCVVEVASLFEPQGWQRERRAHDQFADEINSRVPADQGYFIDFSFDESGAIPPVSRYVAWLRRTLNELPWPPSDTETWEERRFEDQSGHITTRFIPMREINNDPTLRIVGMGPMIGGRVETVTRMRDRVSAKSAARYGIPSGVPYLVAVGVRDFIGVRDSAVWACYGTPTVSIPSGAAGNANDGIFGPGSNGGRNERLSAVAVIWNLRPWEDNLPEVQVMHNPFARKAWPPDFLPATGHFGTLGQTDKDLQLGWLDITSG